ncbi:hypothetical protein LIER_30970 [Lithospermum erythrorhizon]|uniref:Integrase catalytic domain-containing protein n=1 Tax=Lithospermum erythrorhizon TaxID=34254 RepID=A0AAV3RTG4_LITER
MLLRCLSNTEAAQAIAEAHARVRRPHQSGAKLHFQIKRMGYYWLTVVKDCLDYARACKPCQYHANFIHQPPEPLHPTTAAWPFDAWGLDMVGPIPWSKEGHTYILAAMDYFSKWAEAKPLMSDNGKAFNNKMIADLRNRFKIRKYHSTMYYPQANGLAKAFNKTLCNLMKKIQHLMLWFIGLKRSYHSSKNVKLMPKSDGLYIIQKVYPSGVYLMANSEGKPVRPINGRYLKRYYP